MRVINIQATKSTALPGYIHVTVYVGNTTVNLGLLQRDDYEFMVDDLMNNLHNLLLLSDVK